MSECKFRVGDKVWSPLYGHGDIIAINENYKFPLMVKFSNDKIETFTFSGERVSSENQTLFHAGSYIVEAPEPERRYHPKVGELVAGSFNKKRWYAGVFLREDEEGNYITGDGMDYQRSISRFKYCEPVHKHFSIPDKETTAS